MFTYEKMEAGFKIQDLHELFWRKFMRDKWKMWLWLQSPPDDYKQIFRLRRDYWRKMFDSPPTPYPTATLPAQVELKVDILSKWEEAFEHMDFILKDKYAIKRQVEQISNDLMDKHTKSKTFSEWVNENSWKATYLFLLWVANIVETFWGPAGVLDLYLDESVEDEFETMKSLMIGMGNFYIRRMHPLLKWAEGISSREIKDMEKLIYPYIRVLNIRHRLKTKY